MPTIIASVLRSRATEIGARLLLTFPFWGSGLDKLLDFPGATREMAEAGLQPAALFAVLTIVTELGGAAAVVFGRAAWLGAGALGIFTALTIPVAHAFWTMAGAEALIHFFFTVEHVGLIGGLVLVAILSVRRRPLPSTADERAPVHLMAG